MDISQQSLNEFSYVPKIIRQQFETPSGTKESLAYIEDNEFKSVMVEVKR